MKRRTPQPHRSRPTLALSMIVKNGQASLPRCLESVRGIVDEIVIADTGSADQSVEIGLRQGAKVIHIPWENDFAKARNLSLAQVRSDWVLSLDDDELLDSSARSLIPPHLMAKHVMAYNVRIRNYVRNPESRLWDQDSKKNISPPPFAAEFPAYVEHGNARLFRRHPELYFEGCVHESVTYQVQRLGMRIEEARFVIHHLGFADSAKTLAGKAFYYRELGREKVRMMPESAMAHFELGIEESQHFHNYEEAAKLFQRAVEIDPRLGVGWLFLGRSLGALGRHREALAALERATETDGNRAKVFELRGDSLYALGEMEEARRCYLQVVGDLAVEAPEIESKLGLTEVRLGRTQEGLTRLRRALDRNRKSACLYDRLISACVWLGNLPAAAEAAEEKLGQTDPFPESFLRAASIHAQLKDWPRVRMILRRGIEHFPENQKLRRAAAEISIA
ncbi:MAG: glycosyltransferase [Acidobacteriota bacterium]|nr:glycosyltransferase [Acidobacteriota bacterium]